MQSAYIYNTRYSSSEYTNKECETFLCEQLPAMASSANPYEHYNSPEVEDDLIDPDDGESKRFLPMIHCDL